MQGRRTLTFANLDEAMAEVDRLLQGHRTLGRWSLGQICNHLAASNLMAVEGAPFRAPWVVRKTVGPWVLRRILRTGRFPGGVRLPRRHEPPTGLDARAEAEALRGSIRWLSMHSGPMGNHPLADSVPRASWERMLAIHAAHHLGFVIPEDGPVSPGLEEKRTQDDAPRASGGT